MSARVVALGLTLAFWQSPMDREIARLENRRRDIVLYDPRPPIAIAYRAGRPLAWVSVYHHPTDFPFCEVEGQQIAFALSDRMLWDCKDGARAPFVGDYAVVLTQGPTSVVEWEGGKEKLTTLR